MTAGTSTTVYATTSCRAHPSTPPILDVAMIARGAATFAFEHSSERWKGALIPDIVQMTPINDMSTQIPGGNDVPWWIVPQTSVEGVKRERPRSGRSVPAGIIMRTATTARKLKVEPAELNCASHRVGIEEMTPWIIMIQDASRKVWRLLGL